MQIFVAPGDEDVPLLEEESPWELDRWVSIPSEQWDVLLGEARKTDAQLGRMLGFASGGGNPIGDTTIPYDADEIRALVKFLEQLASRIEMGPDLASEATEDVPDVFVPSEHARMLRNVAA